MSERRLFLGVDGGGTKTEFLCIDAEGAVLARAVTGTTYHLQIGLDAAIATIGEGVAAICGELGVGADAFDYVFFGLPAYGEDNAIDPQLAAACGRVLGHSRYTCGNDMICGWAGSLACGDGINIVAGTGSIGYGERQGLAARAGGWGEVFGDEGSAYWIAIQGLNAFSRMSDGRLPRGPLHALLAQALGIADDLEICARIMGEQGMARDAIAGLARVVSQAATGGDEAAIAIVDRAAEELFQLAVAIRAQLGFDPAEAVAISWSGGVLTQDGPVQAALRRRLLAGSQFRIVEPAHPPALGAALYARKLCISGERLR